VDLYIYSLIRLHGVVLSSLSTGTTLPVRIADRHLWLCRFLTIQDATSSLSLLSRRFSILTQYTQRKPLGVIILAKKQTPWSRALPDNIAAVQTIKMLPAFSEPEVRNYVHKNPPLV
jgi:hypothetical protein